MLPAQQYSGISILKNSPYRPSVLKTNPAQRDSIMSNLGMGLIGPMGHIGLMGKKPIMKTIPAQRDSIMSNLGMGLIGLMGPIGLMGKKPVNENRPAQRDSIMSNLAEPVKTAPAQRDSIISKLGVMRIMGIIGGKTKRKTIPAQRDSGNSILKSSPLFFKLDHFPRNVPTVSCSFRLTNYLIIQFLN